MASEHDIEVLLVKTLQNGVTPEERVGAARGLGYMGGHQALPALIKAVGGDPASAVRGAAAEALGCVVGKTRR